MRRDDAGFEKIRSKGDHALFGGCTTKDMKVKLSVKGNKSLADLRPTLTIAAKNLGAQRQDRSAVFLKSREKITIR